MIWSKLSNKLFLAMLFIVICLNTNAQNTFQDYKKAYPDYNEIVLLDFQSYDISIEDKKLKIIQNSNFESMILTENGIHNNQESFTYSELVKLIDYEAFSVVNNNGKEKKIKVTQSTEKQSSQSSVFHDDVKQRQLSFPNLEAGSKKVYHYSREFIDPYLLHKFIFSGGIPIKNASFEVITDKSINIGYKIFNDPNNKIEFTRKEKKDKIIYTWTLKDVKPIKFESNDPGYLHIAPHIDIFIKDYQIGDKKISILGDVEDLHKYYTGFVKNLNKKECIDLKKIAQEITKDKATEEEKVKSIFYWVKNNIKYIAFESGYDGFIPREAELVFERKFGDCKDMANIIVSMSKYANIENVNLCWIGTREIPYSYTELPTPAVDNHMIAAYKKDDTYIYLDATDKETRFGLPTSFIQGKEALINTPNGYTIQKVPQIDAEQNKVNDYVQLQIKDNKLKGNAKIDFHGFNRSSIIMEIGDTSGKTRMEIIKNIVLKGNNKFILNTYTEENLSDRDLPYIINYNFELDNYIIQLEKEIYINPFLTKTFEKNPIQKDRESSYDFEILSQFNRIYEFEIPVNYSIKYKPKNYTIDNELMQSSCNFEVKNNKLIVTHKLQLKKAIITKPEFELWDETIKKLKTYYNESIILMQN
ncbi:MAG: DUF3857 domain-containing protein [Flavobacterium sp.]|uniref:DUF3857 domain-containing protein n=1 Tax=Flavobacterium sp. TaxID=239 RepID=UPI00259292E2|nr:DUF3857 domain-containing protein [uncultured Flavobacterium sp.]